MTPFADQIYFSDTIYPRAVDSHKVTAVAVQSGRIIAVGDRLEMDPLSGPDTVIEDLGGHVILPGLIDAHIHIAGYANSLAAVDCQTDTLEECLERIKNKSQEVATGSWITGHGWDQNIWGKWPTAEKIDRAAPTNPVYLTARSLHASAANSEALRQAGLVGLTTDPEKGLLQRDSEGKLTGILLEAAMQLVSQHIPSPSPQELAQRIERAQQQLWRLGLVGIHDFDGAQCLSALQLLHLQERLGLRVLKHIRYDYLDQALTLGLRSGFGDGWITLGGIKLFSDGALGPRTAAMAQPYDDEPANTGSLFLEEEQIRSIGEKARQGGFPLAIHAIGDRANQVVLSALSELIKSSTKPYLALPYRMEHLQLLREEDLPVPAGIGVIASMQPVHALSDETMAKIAWGARCRRSYAWRSLLEAGTTLAFGSDAPVENPNPFWGLHAAVTRQQRGSPDSAVFIPQERLTLNQALVAYTTGPAAAAGTSSSSGSLAPGHYADFIVLKKDPHQVAAEELYTIKPEGVVVNGDWRFRNF